MRVVRLTFYIAAPILFVLLPSSFFEGGEGICLFKNIFGYQCPGCGMTRAFRAAAHGDLLSAVRYNSSVVVVFPLACLVLAKAITREFTPIAGDDVPRSISRLLDRLRLNKTAGCGSKNGNGG